MKVCDVAWMRRELATIIQHSDPDDVLVVTHDVYGLIERFEDYGNDADKLKVLARKHGVHLVCGIVR